MQPINVRNPYAELLQIPSEVFKPRRTNAHYLQFIEAVTFYHQYQREKQTDTATGETYINTTLEDIAEANKLMKEVLLRKADELSGATRNYFELLKAALQENKQSAFTKKEAKQLLRLPISTVKRYNAELMQSSYIKRNESRRAKAYHFEITSYEEYSQLQNSIITVLDNIYNNLAAHELTTAQKQSEPMKRKPAKAFLSVYEYDGTTTKQSEVHLYGSSRLGMITQLTKEPVFDLLPGSSEKYSISTFTRNEKIYELTNHLGYVLATIGIKK